MTAAETPTTRRSGFALSISAKLVILIVLMMVAMVGFLASYLASSQIDSLANVLRRKAETYGSVMANQVASAVAFSDRETANEVLSSVASDSDVSGVVLYGAGGVVLFKNGSLHEEPKAALAASRVITTSANGVLSVVAPVTSVEGPRGVLVIELSTSSLAVARTRIVAMTLVSGGIALVGGILFAWLLARRLARRLRAIADAATAFAAGDHSQRPVVDRGRDEIGTLATSFNAMLAQIKELLGRLRDMARKEQERLERLVAERTEQLDRRNAEMRLVFDHVDQGFVMVDVDGPIADERSAAVEAWLGPIPESKRITDYVRSFAPAVADWFELQWTVLQNDILPVDLALAQLPSQFVVGGRNLELTFKSLVDPTCARRVLVVVTDVTSQRRRARAERDDRERSKLFARLLVSAAGFQNFIDETDRQVATVATGEVDVAYLRTVHTLKGNCALEGVESIAEICHALESALQDDDDLGTQEAQQALVARWRWITETLSPLIAHVRHDRIELNRDELTRFEAMLEMRVSHRDLAKHVTSWRDERVIDRFTRLADDTRMLAARLGKLSVDVEVEVDPALRLPNGQWSEFWCAFSHAIRNSLDHGLEATEERIATGKPEVGRVVLRAHEVDGELVIAVEDDGRGIDWAQIEAKAFARGLPAASRRDLEAALFVDGLSTREMATDTSGRGVGTAALRDACERTGGRIAVTSERGAGTSFSFSWSRPGVAPAIQTH